MPKFNPTREQRLALLDDRHLSVTANAGSGKTKVLVDKYIDLLLNNNDSDCDPSKIVAITFTDKAANEMKAKIIKSLKSEFERLNELSLSGDIDNEEIAKLKKIKSVQNKIYYGRISTIHSFCSNILRDYPIEAGILPNFSIMDDITYNRIFDKEYNRLINNILEGDDENQKSDFIRLFILLKDDNLKEYIKKIINEKLIFSKLEELYNSDNSDIRAAYFQFIKENILNYISDFLTHISIALQSEEDEIIVEAKKHKNYDKFKIDFDNFRNYVSNVNDIDDLKDFAANYKLMRDNKKGNAIFVKFICKSDYFIGKEELTEFAYDKLLEKKINEVGNENTSLYEVFVEINQTLHQFAAEINENIDKKKKEQNSFTFNDLITKTYELLQVKENNIGDEIKFLLIDEYQDTDPLQYKIVKLILDDYKKKDKKLFIVGDLKQSIYRFRNADIRVMNETIEDIKKINSSAENLADTFDGIEMNKEESSGVVKLLTSFRLQPVPAAFINQNFSKIMKRTDNNEFEVEYEPLTCFMNETITNTLMGDLIPNNGNYGSVTFLLNEVAGKSYKKNEEEDEDEEENSIEITEVSDDVQLVANHINKIVANPEYTIIEIDGSGQPVKREIRYSDIKIIAAKTKRFAELINGLTRNSIPVVSVGSKGFYQNQEILDLISILEFLSDTNNDIALTGLLRSPFFSINETEFLRIAFHSKSKNSFWFKLKKYVNDRIEDSSPELIRAEMLLNRIIEAGNSNSVSFILLKIIKETSWHRLMVDDELYEQKAANIMKFVQLAAEYENLGFRDINDFINDLKDYLEKDDQTNAILSEVDNAVEVLTVHKSKGLESQVLIVFDLNSRGSNQHDNFSEDFGYFKKLEVWNSDKKSMTPKNTYLKVALDLVDSKKRNAEEKRLLYVALTRVKSHLILTSKYSLKKDGDLVAFAGFSKLLFGDGKLNNLFLSDEQTDYKANINVFNGKEEKTYKIDYSLNLVIKRLSDKLEVVTPKGLNDQAVSEAPRFLNGNFDDNKSINELFSATKIIAFKARDNGEKYFHNYKLGMRSDGEEVYNNFSIQADAEDDIGIGATEFGTIMHNLLQKINLWYEGNGKVNVEILKSLIESELIVIADSDKESLNNKLLNDCTKVAETNLVNSHIDEIFDAEYEYDLTMPVGDDFLTGSIDVLINHKNGDFEIWDWKTNKIGVNEIEKTARKYEYQMKIYTCLLSLERPQLNYKAKLIFTHLADKSVREEDWTFSFKWSKEEIESILNSIINDIKEIKEKSVELKVY